MTDHKKWVDHPAATQLARRTTCRRCGRRVLQGLDDFTCAMTVTVDADPVTPETELAALIAGFRTYTAWPAPRGINLARRYSWRIRRPVPHPTHIEHDCNRTWPAKPAPITTPVDPEECPF